MMNEEIIKNKRTFKITFISFTITRKLTKVNSFYHVSNFTTCLNLRNDIYNISKMHYSRSSRRELYKFTHEKWMKL